MNKILLIITGSIAASRCKEIITLLNINEVKTSCIPVSYTHLTLPTKA